MPTTREIPATVRGAMAASVAADLHAAIGTIAARGATDLRARVVGAMTSAARGPVDRRKAGAMIGAAATAAEAGAISTSSASGTASRRHPWCGRRR